MLPMVRFSQDPFNFGNLFLVVTLGFPEVQDLAGLVGAGLGEWSSFWFPLFRVYKWYIQVPVKGARDYIIPQKARTTSGI